ncbi:MAG: transposase [Nitrospirota bacterium]|nr:transposase [Nitrospirota bacterium]
MSRPLRIQYPGAVYHVTCRGNERKDIFRDDADRERFVSLLEQSAEIYSVTVYAYVLMTNHFHLLVETPLGNLGEFMRRFNISYTGYFNRRHGRVGHLYQGRYTSLLVDKDEYLTTVSRYIHLNPVRTKVWSGKTVEEKASFLDGYQWSSLPGYCEKKKREKFIDYALVLEPYGGDSAGARRRYRDALLGEISSPQELKKQVVGQSILGGDEFVRWVKEKLGDRGADRECPPLRAVVSYNAQDEILAAVASATGKTIGQIKSDRGVVRQIAMELLARVGGLKGKEIGELLGVDYSTVSVGRKRLRDTLASDRAAKRLLERVEGTLSIIKN